MAATAAVIEPGDLDRLANAEGNERVHIRRDDTIRLDDLRADKHGIIDTGTGRFLAREALHAIFGSNCDDESIDIDRD